MEHNRQKERRQQLNKNAGFSLLELLIAVTILAIITIPMLHMFVTSARVNGKSRITLRATVLAQDIIEGLKAYHIDEIQDQFNGVEDFELLNAAIITGDCTYTEDTERENGEDGRYYFVLRNASLEKSKFDALISVDASGYVEDKEEATLKKHDSYLNSRDVAKIASLNKSSDASYTHAASMNDTALSKAKEVLGIPGENVSYKTAGLRCTRTFTFSFKDARTVTDKEGVTKQQTEAYASCNYEFSYGGKTYTYIPEGMGTDEAGNSGLPCGTFTGSNFYFFYTPLYAAGIGSTGSSQSDKIVFQCKQTNALNLYIAKQIAEGMSDTELNAAENAYSALVNIEDSSKDHFTVRTNLGINLVNDTFLESIHGNAKIQGQVVYQQNGSTPVNKLNIFDLGGIRDEVHGIKGDNDLITEFIYDITVEVYEQGAAEQGFPTDMRKVTIDGTKNY